VRGMALFEEVAAKLSPYIDAVIQKIVEEMRVENTKTNSNINQLREELKKAGLIK